MNDFNTWYKSPMTFYTLNIMFESNYEKISRRFMKIQELSALVGGFMKIILLIAELLIVPYNKFLMRLSLVNQFYDCSSDEAPNPMKNVNEVKSFQQIENKNKKNNNKNTNVVIDNNNPQSNQVQNKNDSQSLSKRSNFKISDKASKDLTLSYLSLFKETLSVNKETKFNINYFQYLFKFIFKPNKLKVLKFSTAENLLNHKLDIAYYLEITKQFEIMKKCLWGFIPSIKIIHFILFFYSVMC